LITTGLVKLLLLKAVSKVIEILPSCFEGMRVRFEIVCVVFFNG